MIQELKKLSLILAESWVAPTIRLLNDPWPQIRELKSTGKNIIFCLWHEYTAYCFYFYRNQKAGLLIEDSPKGDVLAAMTKRFGYLDFRIKDDTKDRQTIKGTIQFIKYLREKNDGVIALDGPNGPYRKAKPGVITIAQKTDTLIVPAGIWYEKKVRLNFRWDKYQVPLPFSRAVLLIDQVFSIPAELSEIQLSEKILELEKTINTMNEKAEELGKELLKKGG